MQHPEVRADTCGATRDKREHRGEGAATLGQSKGHASGCGHTWDVTVLLSGESCCVVLNGDVSLQKQLYKRLQSNALDTWMAKTLLITLTVTVGE